MKYCSVHNKDNNEPVRDHLGPIKFPVFMFKYFNTTLEGWQMNLICFLNGITKDFKWQSYRGLLSWGKWNEQFYIEITPGTKTIQLWPIRDWLSHQWQQLILQIKDDIFWLRRGGKQC